MTNFYYDPVKQGYETTTFKTLGGVPAINGSILRLTSASTVHLADLYKCDMTIEMIVPVAPTAGHSRFFGFSNLALGSSLGFDITGLVFSAVATDNNGNTTSVVIPFVADWAAVKTSYTIQWRGPQAIFLVNGQRVAKLTDLAVPKNAMSLYLSNQVADNMDVSGIDFKNIETMSVPLSVTVTP